jgi:hypothetical protein
MERPPIIPPQSAQVPPCPVCNRPVYPDVEHNPVCAAVANLQSLVYKAAGTLEEDSAGRWAELHERITGHGQEMSDELKTELQALRDRIAALEEKTGTTPPAPAADATQEKPKDKQPEASGEPPIVAP